MRPGRTDKTDLSALKRRPEGGYVSCHPCDDTFTVEVLKACAIQTYNIQKMADTFGFLKKNADDLKEAMKDLMHAVNNCSVEIPMDEVPTTTEK